MNRILNFGMFINEQKSSTPLKAGKIVTKKDPGFADSPKKKPKTPKKPAPEEYSDKIKKMSPLGDSSSGASSGDSDVRSPTSTRTEVRSPTSTETSTDAYTAGNVTVTGGAGEGDTIVHIHSVPEEYERLASGKGRKKHMPSAVAMKGPNDKKSY